MKHEPRPEITVSIQEITPSIAAKWLNAQPAGSQRPLAETNVAWLAQQLESKEFALNGESLIFNGTRILDGQHRLTACVRTGIGFKSVVVQNVPADVFPTLDSGRKRGVSDALHIAGYSDRTLLAAVLRWIHAEINGELGWTKTSLVPHVEAVRLAKLHDVTASLAIGYKMGRKLLPPAMAAFLHYRFMEIDPTAAELFFMDLVSGEGLQKNRPVYQLRERLMANRLAKAKLPQREIMAITIKAFKMERQGKKIEHLRWRNQGAQAEPFPQFEDDL